MEAERDQVPLARTLSFSDMDSYGFWFNAYFQSVKRARVWIVLFWSVCMVWGTCTGFDYIRQARDSMKAPEGTRAGIDQSAFEQEFKELSESMQLIILVACDQDNSDCSVACMPSACGQDCKGFNSEIADFVNKTESMLYAYSDQHSVGYKHESVGFYQLTGTDRELVRCQFSSETGRETFMAFTTNINIKSDVRYALIDYINDEVIPLVPQGYHAGVTGFDAMTKDGSEAAVEQTEEIDMITMPIAFILLAYMVRSWRLLLISFLNMAMSITTSLGILNVLTKASGKYPMTSTASLVEVLSLAMGIDYSLFLLRRFRDEIKNGREPELAIKIMLAQAGHVVVMSALTIICVFGGFLFMKSTSLMVQGIACVVCITCCLLVNLTVTPSMLLLFPHFFSYFGGLAPGRKEEGFFTSCWRSFCACTKSCCRRVTCGRCCAATDDDEGEEVEEHSGGASRRTALLHATDSTPGPGTVSPGQYMTSPTSSIQRQRGGPYKGWYFRLLVKITQWPFNLITLVVLYVCVIPFAIQAVRINRNQDLRQAIPRDSQSGKVYRELLDAFNGGMLNPIYLMLEADPDRNNSVIDKHVFEQLVEISHIISNTTQVPLSDLNSIAMFQGKSVPFKVVDPAFKPIQELVCYLLPKICGAYAFAWKQSVNSKATSTVITIMVSSFDPMGPEIEGFVGDLFRIIDEYSVRPPVTALHLAGVQVGMVEDMRISFDEFPLLVGMTCLVVFTLVGVMLKSAFVIVRLTLTVILPLAAMFGLSVLVFQTGILNWTGIAQLQGSEEGFFYFVPLLVFTLTIGLALDYDVFLILRIREHRFSGLSIRAAILRSMWEVNSTILCAGAIMTLAFGSLLFSNTAAVNQMAFVLASSVLFDSLVVQSICVPCIMSFADSNAWWPSKPPMENLISLEEEIEQRNKGFSNADGTARIHPDRLSLD